MSKTLCNVTEKEIVYEGKELFTDGFPREMEVHIFQYISPALKKYVCSKVCKDWYAQFHKLKVLKREIIKECPIAEFIKIKDKKKYRYEVIAANRVDLLRMVIDKNRSESLTQLLRACESGSLESAKWLHTNNPPLPGVNFHLSRGVRSGKLEVLKWMTESFPFPPLCYLHSPIAMALKMKRLDMFDILAGILCACFNERTKPEIRQRRGFCIDEEMSLDIFAVLTPHENKNICATIITINPRVLLIELGANYRQVETTEEMDKFEQEIAISKVKETVRYTFDPSEYPNILRWAKEVNLC